MKKALISTADKTGVADLARGLAALGYEIISTGGTAAHLEKESIPVTHVSAVTGFPEILGGRVKTLHPKIFGGILAEDTPAHRAECEREGIDFLDIICVNLYPFRATVARAGVTMTEAVENIDIGGVALLRAAAKNHSRVTCLVNPDDYTKTLAALQTTGAVATAERLRLAHVAFSHTAAYDLSIAAYLDKQVNPDGV